MNSSSTGEVNGDSPTIQLARFVGPKKIELFRSRTADLEYIAISHVWGDTEWLPLLGLPSVPVSSKKAAFVEERLPALVGKRAFWMDVLCVDQRSPTAVLEAARNSPTIFRDARKTIAVRAGDGFFDCCAAAIKRERDFGNMLKALLAHVSGHWKTKFQESFLRRVWTLQEMLWSRSIDFVSDSQEPPDDSRIDINNIDLHAGFKGLTLGDDIPPLPGMPDTGPYDPQTSALVLLDALFMMAHCFYLSPILQNSSVGVMNFMQAFFQNGSVSRHSVPARTAKDDIYMHDFLTMHAGSARCASKPQDYILATMSQFPWYQQGASILDLSFSELFLDFYKQSCAAGHPLTCRITRSMIPDNLYDPYTASGDEWLPSADQPEPQGLGEFLKLIGKKTKTMDGPDSYYVAAKFSVLAVPEVNHEVTFILIRAAMQFSKRIWFETSRGGELGRHGDRPERTVDQGGMLRAFTSMSSDERSENPHIQGMIDHLQRAQEIMEKKDRARWASPAWIDEQAYKIVNLMWLGVGSANSPAHAADWKAFRENDAPRIWSKPMQDTVLLLAAMVGCQLPLSALAWARERFIPIIASYANSAGTFLCLLSKRACTREAGVGQELYVVGRHASRQTTGQDLVLASCDTVVPVGLVPDFLAYDRSEQELMAYMAGMASQGFPKSVKEVRVAKKKEHET